MATVKVARNNRFRILLALLMGCALAGCAGTPAIKAAIVAGPDVNPDARGRPSPIVVRLFELRSLAAFETADFFSLFERDKETLGAELIARDEITLVPGEQKTFARDLKTDTRYVGVIAAYRDLERATWRAAVPLTKKKLSIAVRLDARTLSVRPQ